MNTGILSKELIEQIAELPEEDRLSLFRFIEFLKYEREHIEDTTLTKHIQAGLNDDFLTVPEAIQYLETLDGMGDSN